MPRSFDALTAAWGRLPDNLRGILWLLMGSLCFALNDVVTKMLGKTYHPVELAFFRYAFGLVVLAPVALHMGLAELKTQRLGMHALRAMTATIGQLGAYYAVIHMLLADATAIGFSRPLFTTVAAVLILREVVGRGRWTATVAGFLGVLIMVRPGRHGVDPAALAAIGAAFFFALSVVLIRLLARTEPPNRILIYYHLAGVLVFAVPAALLWVTPVGIDWLLLALLAVLQTAAMVGYVRAFAIGEASVIGPFEYGRLIYAVLFGYFLFAEAPDGWTFAGAAIIVLATLYIAREEARRGRRPAGGG
jgi:drug/metabolite transporter (DMT)-like permease